jgi:hypothetical protein
MGSQRFGQFDDQCMGVLRVLNQRPAEPTRKQHERLGESYAKRHSLFGLEVRAPW